MDSVRVRLVFEDRHMLRKPLKSEGLKRSWLLLRPQQETISDLSSYLLQTFDLDHSCPNGLLLSMDGFVLPPFESTGIFKDKDIICVRKKGCKLSDIIKVKDGANSVDEVEIVEKQPLLAGVPLLANEEFEKETGGYQSEPEEDVEDHAEGSLPVENSSCEKEFSKKRTASEKLQGSKKKKQRAAIPEGVENDCHTEQFEIGHHDGGVLPRKSSRRKEHASAVKRKPEMASTPENTQKINKNVESMPREKSGQLQESGNEKVDVAHAPDGNPKVPSRSARRKKAKRQWLKELAKLQKKEVADQPKGLLHWKPLPKEDTRQGVIEHQQPKDPAAAAADVVPIVIRPGHIRFEPQEKDQVVQQSQVSVETSHWNGITSKRKGQKWGREKISSSRRNDYRDLDKEYIETLTIEKEIHINDPIDFDKLAPYNMSPKVGDVISYRLLELSSSWTPELSSFRIGTISRYNPKSNRIMLIPVPEYPIVSEKKVDEDASAVQQDGSLYREDGSLETDFKSLIDVRLVKQSNSDTSKAATGIVNGSPASDRDAVSNMVPTNNDKQTNGLATENGEVNLWDQFSGTLNSKKAQLSQENGWNQGTSGKSSWSYRALRSSALGPTMALLRSKNNI